jgi:hypothetical protein
MNIAEAKNALLVPQNVKQVVAPKTQGNTRKTNKYCTNCGMINHNMETRRKKKEQTTMQHNIIKNHLKHLHMHATYMV